MLEFKKGRLDDNLKKSLNLYSVVVVVVSILWWPTLCAWRRQINLLLV